MKNLSLTYDEVHDLVDRSDAYWDGWTAVFVDRRRDGFMSIYGEFRGGRWVTTFRASPNSLGVWKVPQNFIKQRTR